MNRVRLDQFNNNQFNPGSIASRTAWYAVSLILFETAIPFPSALKRTVLRSFGADIGEGVIIKPRVHIKFPWKLEIGKHTWIGERVWQRDRIWSRGVAWVLPVSCGLQHVRDGRNAVRHESCYCTIFVIVTCVLL